MDATKSGERAAQHATFSIERHYAFARDKVFAAWADPRAKGRWFGGADDWERSGLRLDFREGGEERVSGGPPGGPLHHYRATYHDIVPNERIVYSYEIHLDATRISVSLTTVEFRATATGCSLLLTEQDVFLDGYDGVADRERGTRELLDKLDRELQRAA